MTFADFIASLSLNVTTSLATDEQVPRVLQMTQKTNQFNFTTERLTSLPDGPRRMSRTFPTSTATTAPWAPMPPHADLLHPRQPDDELSRTGARSGGAHAQPGRCRCAEHGLSL